MTSAIVVDRPTPEDGSLPVRAFNLLDEPWIPVRDQDGKRTTVGFRDLIVGSNRIVDVEPNPPIAYAPILRFAAAIVLRSQNAPLGNPSIRVWQKWGQDSLRAGPDLDALNQYLNRWSDRFHLLHPTHPFLQDPAIATECAKKSTTNKLVMERASGNNALWWSKQLDAQAPPVAFGDAAISLLVQWAYGSGGRCATRAKIGDSKQSPLRGRTQYLPKGPTLWGSVLAMTIPALNDHRFTQNDFCPWEQEPGVAPTIPGQLTRLTASPRGLLLVGTTDAVTNMYLTWGTRVPETFWDDDVATKHRFITKTATYAPVRLASTAPAWQDAPGLLAKFDPNAGSDHPPLVLDATRNPLGTTVEFTEFGISVITHFADKSKDEDSIRTELPDLIGRLEVLNEQGFTAVRQYCGFVNELGDLLKAALGTKAKRSGRPAEPVIAQREALQVEAWRQAEQLFWVSASARTWERQAITLSQQWRRLVENALDEPHDPDRVRAAMAELDKYIKGANKLTKKFGLDAIIQTEEK